MALFNCPECNKEISDKAVACPNCGCPVETINIPIQTTKNNFINTDPKPKKFKKKKAIIICSFIFVAVIILGIGSWFCYYNLIPSGKAISFSKKFLNSIKNSDPLLEDYFTDPNEFDIADYVGITIEKCKYKRMFDEYQDGEIVTYTQNNNDYNIAKEGGKTLYYITYTVQYSNYLGTSKTNEVTIIVENDEGKYSINDTVGFVNFKE